MKLRISAALCVSLLTAPMGVQAADAKAAAATVTARVGVPSDGAPANAATTTAAPASPVPSTPSAVPAVGADPSRTDVVPAAANEPTTVIGPLTVKPASAALDDADAVPGVNAADEDPESLVGTLFRTFLVLGIVVGLIYVTLNYGLRKIMGVRGMPMGRSSLVKVIERIPLDPRRTLFVIQAGGEYLLVGGGEEGLSLISKLDGAEVSKVLEQRTAAAGASSAFLQKLLSRGAPPAAPNPAPGTPPTTAPTRGEMDKV